MPTVSDDEAAELAISSISSPPSPKQLTALKYIEENILSQVHQEHFFVDIQKAFQAYDVLYFTGALTGKVDVGWSARMTLCAGICEPRTFRSDGKRSTWPEGINVRVKLSEAILKFRPSVDVLNTLLHEMIHAYLLVVSGTHVRRDDPSGHGFGFLSLANAINKHSQNFYSITVYHNFQDEVDHYRTHMWQCTGPCTAKPPFFGLVKRAMNRPPGPSDSWFQQHQETCGGDFVKIAGPPPKTKIQGQRTKISNWIKPVDATGSKETKSAEKVTTAARPTEATTPEAGQGRKRRRDTNDDGSRNIFGEGADDDNIMIIDSRNMVVCPICFDKVWEGEINQHLDNTHGL
ncbi:SprT-like family-domain-containing protein [Kalaharituber pfeilii]|nr:SprT-like family-domain-containing protein [Kalaharituber pfeilii]